MLLFLFIFTASSMAGEAGPRFGFIVDSTADAVDANPGDGLCASVSGECTLRAAIMESNALPGEDSISLQEGLYQLTLIGTDEDLSETGDLDITDDLTLIGMGGSNGCPISVIDGNQTDRVFQVFYDRVVHMEMIQIQGGKAPGDTQSNPFLDDDGGGIQSSGHLELVGVVITNNSAPFLGGGISAGHETRIDDSIISNNMALEGGGISISGDAIISNSLITQNTATRWGGGIHLVGGSSMELSTSEVSQNITTENYHGLMAGGGGIMSSGEAILSNVEIIDNQSAGHGGGVFAFSKYEDTFVVQESTIADNHSDQSGGGFYNDGSSQINTSSIQRNSAQMGGGVFNSGYLSVDNSTLQENTATNGAGIYNTFASIEDNLIGDLHISHSTLMSNIADRNGGGIHNKASAFVNDVLFQKNQAEAGAGFNFDSTPYLWEENKPTVSIVASEFILNESLHEGGAIHNSAGLLTVENTTIQ